MPSTRAIGKVGEDIAADYLLSQGYKILDRNFAYKKGEIDIVAQEQDVLVFVEVKNYAADSLKNIHFAVDLKKQKKIFRTAEVYLQRKNIVDKYTRFDVLLISSNNVSKVAEIELIRDAFRG